MSAKESVAYLKPEPSALVPCPKCGPEHRACENGCNCKVCNGLHSVPAYVCQRCAALVPRLQAQAVDLPSSVSKPWLCDDCWSREVLAKGVLAPVAKASDEGSTTPEPEQDDVARDQICKKCVRLVDCGLRKGGVFCETLQKTGKVAYPMLEHTPVPGTRLPQEEAETHKLWHTERAERVCRGCPSLAECEFRKQDRYCDDTDSVMSLLAGRPQRPINVMPERPLVTALDRMVVWLEHSELTSDQSRLCESLLKKLQLCSAAVMNAQLRRSWKPRDAS